MNLTTAQSIPIVVTSTATRYYLQIEGYAGAGCKFDAVLTPPGIVCNLLPLPVGLVKFTANAVDNEFVDLDWETSTEVNNDYFTIERSKDSEIFEVVGYIDGAGNSNMIKEYNSVDEDPYKGISYYRLRQTDFDGEYAYSKVEIVNIESNFGDLKVFPNPIEGVGHLTFNSTSDNIAEVVLFDVTGKRIISEKHPVVKGENSFKLPTDNLPQGMYFLTVGNDTETSNIKFIKN